MGKIRGRIRDRTWKWKMTGMVAAGLVMAFGGSAAAQAGKAQTWKARAELIETKSAEGCPRQLSVYTLTLTGSTFRATDVDGEMVDIVVPAHNVIHADYRSSSGARLEMSGNVKTRHLEIYSNLRGCWWRLVPEKA